LRRAALRVWREMVVMRSWLRVDSRPHPIPSAIKS
jgi:hypothetical protein